MLAGIYYGAKYGGSTTSILLNVPGESASVVTCIDGYQMAKQGPRRRRRSASPRSRRSSPARSAWSALMLVAPPLAQLRARLQLARVFRADGARPRHGGAARRRVDDEGAARDAGRAVDRRHGHRSLHARPRASPSASCELLDGIDFVVVAIGVFAARRGARQHGEPRRRADAAGAEGPAQPAADAGRT